MDDVTEEETTKVIESLKNSRAAGSGQIPAVLLKQGGHSTLTAITNLRPPRSTQPGHPSVNVNVNIEFI